MIEPIITIGNLITIASIVVGVVSLIFKLSRYHADNQSRLAVIETRVDAIWRWFIDRTDPRDG